MSGKDFRVEIDTSKLERFTRKLAGGLDKGGQQVAQRNAEMTANEIRAGTPRLTGRLASSIQTTRVTNGYGVAYGSGVPYAGKIERREHMVETAVDNAPDRYASDQHELAQSEARHG